MVKSTERKEVAFYCLAWIWGGLFVLLKGNLLNLMGGSYLDLDLLSILIAYILLCYGPMRASTYAFGQGLLTDLFSGGLHGLYTFLYLVVFFGIFVSCRFFSLQHPKAQILIVSVAILLKNTMFVVILSVFSQKIVLVNSFVWMSIGSIVMTSLTAPAFFFLFDQMRVVSEKETPAL